MTKMTKKIALEIAIEAIGDANTEAVEKLQSMKAQLEKKATGERKPTATQKENVKIKADFAEFLADGTLRTATQIGDAFGLSNQKASALLRQMIDEGTVVKVVDKRASYFKIAE